jgi:hypothetical protein
MLNAKYFSASPRHATKALFNKRTTGTRQSEGCALNDQNAKPTVAKNGRREKTEWQEEERGDEPRFDCKRTTTSQRGASLISGGWMGSETNSQSQKRESTRQPIASSRPERSKLGDATTRCPSQALVCLSLWCWICVSTEKSG